MTSLLYQAYQNHADLTAPWRTGAAHALKYLNLLPQGISDKFFRRLAAALELISRTSLTYTRPAYGIDRVMVGNQELEVTEEVAFAIWPFLAGLTRWFTRYFPSFLPFSLFSAASDVPVFWAV